MAASTAPSMERLLKQNLADLLGTEIMNRALQPGRADCRGYLGGQQSGLSAKVVPLSHKDAHRISVP
jgi:hypothetical protein